MTTLDLFAAKNTQNSFEIKMVMPFLPPETSLFS